MNAITDTQARTLRDSLSEQDTLFTRAEAAIYLRRSVPTLERWAKHGEGPAFRLIGGRALYALIDLRQFAKSAPVRGAKAAA